MVSISIECAKTRLSGIKGAWAEADRETLTTLASRASTLGLTSCVFAGWALSTDNKLISQAFTIVSLSAFAVTGGLLIASKNVNRPASPRKSNNAFDSRLR